MFRSLSISLLCLGLTCFLTGCISSEPPKQANGGGEHGHSHDEHIHGPHNGPVFEVGKEDFHVEWLKDGESGTVTLYFVDHEGKTETPIEAEKVTINIVTKMASGDTTTPYELPAIDPKEGKASKFELVSKDLESKLSLLAPGGVEAELSFATGGKEHKAAIERDDHH